VVELEARESLCDVLRERLGSNRHEEGV